MIVAESSADEESQPNVYGAVSSLPTTSPSTRNSTSVDADVVGRVGGQRDGAAHGRPVGRSRQRDGGRGDVGGDVERVRGRADLHVGQRVEPVEHLVEQRHVDGYWSTPVQGASQRSCMTMLTQPPPLSRAFWTMSCQVANGV